MKVAKRVHSGFPFLVWAILLVLLAAAGCGSSSPVSQEQEAGTAVTFALSTTTAAAATTAYREPTAITKLGEGVVDSFERLVAGDARPLYESFSSSFKQEMPLDTLEGTWDATNQLSGSYLFTSGMRYEDDGVYRAVTIEAVFEQRLVDVRFVFDENDKVSGLFFEQPPENE